MEEAGADDGGFFGTAQLSTLHTRATGHRRHLHVLLCHTNWSHKHTRPPTRTVLRKLLVVDHTRCLSLSVDGGTFGRALLYLLMIYFFFGCLSLYFFSVYKTEPNRKLDSIGEEGVRIDRGGWIRLRAKSGRKS